MFSILERLVHLSRKWRSDDSLSEAQGELFTMLQVAQSQHAISPQEAARLQVLVYRNEPRILHLFAQLTAASSAMRNTSAGGVESSSPFRLQERDVSNSSHVYLRHRRSHRRFSPTVRTAPSSSAAATASSHASNSVVRNTQSFAKSTWKRFCAHLRRLAA